ncbi:protease [Nesidiocoris tenuis]|uniref:Protease n=1 Tax=Nesidiocoris tenuis TaxID=355587 RepID=A0ABN7B9K6_9HEMI|nr:protease [Nesidiocoris tenuis]
MWPFRAFPVVLFLFESGWSAKSVSSVKVPFLYEPHIEITVSPIVTPDTLRILDISWRCEDNWVEGDWVALYNVEPTEKSQPSKFSHVVKEDEGWVRTYIPENRTFPETPSFKKQCLGWYAAYWRQSDMITLPVATTCLTTNPTWMEDNWESIKSISLRNIFLPGTHDAGAYQLAYSPFEPNRFQKYVYAQDESIMEQLIHGARYLDFRIGRYPSAFWLNHDIARVHILEYVLEDVKLFLNKTKEIVVIDVHAFPVGFKNRPDSHAELIQYFRTKMGDHLLAFMGYDTTMQQIMDTGKRLIIAYNDAGIVAKNTMFLWYPISQKWGDVKSVADLYKYLESIMHGRHPRSTMWSAMAEMTPDAWGVIVDKYKGLRTMADLSNHNVTEWFYDEWGGQANIVAVDFIRSTGIVSTAIKWNKAKTAMVPTRSRRTTIFRSLKR